MLINEKMISYTKLLSVVGVAGLCLSLWACFGLGATNDASALTYQSRVGVGFTFESSINVSLSSSNLKIMDLMPGTVADSNAITVKVLTNNANGYVLNSTVGSDTVSNDNGAIYNTRQLIHSTYAATDNSAIAGGTGTKPVFASLAYGADLAEITDGNQWGYSYLDPGNNNNTTWSAYSGLPLYSDSTNVATLKSKETPSTEQGDTVSFKIAARAGNGQTSGEYNNVINFLVVGNPDKGGTQTTEAGCINYYPNGSNVEGTMGCQPISASATSATLLASNFSRTGYGFAGWSDVYDYATNPNAHFYGPQETITFTAGQYTSPNNGLSLYAVWVRSQGSIQDATKVASVCNSLTTAPTDGTANLSSVSALTDQRDNNTYAIARLADGNCWMIENLRLDNTAEHNSDGTLAQGYGTSATHGNFIGLANPESVNFSGSTSANSLYYSGTQSGTASIDIGTSNEPSARMPRYNNLNTINRASNPTSNTFAENNTTRGMYSYGNYYTWSAAIADLAYNGVGNTSVTNTSLCPTGWRLPRGGSRTRIASNDDNDFWNLTVDALNGGINPANYDDTETPNYTGTVEAGPVAAKFRSYPNNFLYSGYFGQSSARVRGSYGTYWSSTADRFDYSYYLSLGSSSVYPGTMYANKFFGRSIRCVVNN